MPPWQDIAALALVLLAAGFVARSIWRTVRGRPGMGCAACDRCPGWQGRNPALTAALDAPKPGEQNCQRE